MTQDPHDTQERIQLYRDIVQAYETVDKQIDALIMRNGGASRNMSAADREEYKELARKRSELHNEMRILEQALFTDES